MNNGQNYSLENLKNRISRSKFVKMVYFRVFESAIKTDLNNLLLQLLPATSEFRQHF